MRWYTTVVLLVLLNCVWAEGEADVLFVENKGQWPEQVLYRAYVPGGALFVERKALTFVLRSGGPQAHHGSADPGLQQEPLRAHAYQVRFDGADPATGEGVDALPHYENHFIGNDPGQWGSRCAVYPEVLLRGLYPGISLRLSGGQGLKYDLIIEPGADPDLIRMQYVGTSGLTLANGTLVVRTSAGTVVEEAPVAFSAGYPSGNGAASISAERIMRECRYVLNGDVLTFSFPQGHPAQDLLVIDPVLTFSSYSGSAADNFGFTASYDASGHLYGGGIVFGIGYPTTLGVLDDTFNTGAMDIGLTKFEPDGTGLVWSTYLGGSGNESPHSLVVNSNDELYVLGTTGSLDLPTTPGAVDITFNGGVPVILNPISGVNDWENVSGGYGYSHVNGTDILVARISAAGDALLASTYVGGTGNDGLNNNTGTVFNYGDHFRGEIALDAQERPIIASCTQSADAPTSAGTPQGTFGGGMQDAYLFRLDAMLSTFQFATFLGGSGDESGYGVQVDSNGNIFFTGGTTSSNLPMTGTTWDNTANGGTDGFLAKYSPTGTTMLANTYLGTPAYDQSFLVQLNLADEVYIVGQSEGGWPVTSGKYADPGSAQFVQKMSNDLTTRVWSTVIGTGSGSVDISLSAFLVSDCGQIYISGWGGNTNQSAQATNSTTTGLPLTADAFQPSTNGSDFYLMVLNPDAVDLAYATYFGGLTSHEHVDGGTSRFDKSGNVYQAVCAGCGSHDDFPSTPGAWSATNGSTNCNLGVFKFNVVLSQAIIDIAGPSYVCLGSPADFLNQSFGGNGYHWEFGDANSSTQFEPSHTYADAGVYTVRMILTDTNSCVPNDTAYITIEVLDPNDAFIDPVDTLCLGGTQQLMAHGGYQYAWLPDPSLSDTTIADPTVSPSSTTTYTVIVTDSCGVDTASVTVVVQQPVGLAGPDEIICSGDIVQIHAAGGASYLWSPAGLMLDATVDSPFVFPTDTTWFVVEITTPEGCTVMDSLQVFVQTDPPQPMLTDTLVCEGGSVTLQANGGLWYDWTPVNGITQLNIADPTVTPAQPTYYPVLISNACGSVLDSIFVDVLVPMANAWPDTIICPGESVQLSASGGISYVWSPSAGLSDVNAQFPTATPSAPTRYQVIATIPPGCTDTAWVEIDLFPTPWVSAGNDITIAYGDNGQLNAQGAGSFTWTPVETLSCSECPSPIASPLTSTNYLVTLVDTNGCVAMDMVNVFVEGTLFVPNTFTPNGDGINDGFRVFVTEVRTYRLIIFNRWGEEIYRTEKVYDSWDGRYNGTESPIDTYVWRVDLTEESGEERTLYGHVNLVR